MRTRKVLASLALAASMLAAGSNAQAASAVTINYTVDNGTGSAVNFGGGLSIMSFDFGYDMLKDHGVNFIRHEVFLDQIVPQFLPGTYDETPATIADYRSNTNGLADPANWYWNGPVYRYDVELDTALASGLPVLLVLSNSVPWLSVNPAVHKSRGAPAADDVYYDIVRKIYQRYQSKVGAIEIWNEPDMAATLDLTGDARYNSGATEQDRIAAYRDIYNTAASAIRSVNLTVSIGGPVTRDPVKAQTYLTSMLADTRISDRINFISYHRFGLPDGEPAAAALRLIAAASGKPSLPIFLTAWNRTDVFDANPLNSASDAAIAFVAHRLTDMIYAGVAANALFRVQITLDGPVVGSDGCGGSPDDLDFYSIGHFTGGQPPLVLLPTPKLRAYRLLSKALGLGAGDFQLKGRSVTSGNVVAGAAINAAGEKVLWVINPNTTDETTTITLAGLTPSASHTITGYKATPVVVPDRYNEPADAEAKTPAFVITGSSTSTGGGNLPITVPALSVVGIKLTPN